MAGSLAAGYLLGRTKQMKFALMMGSWAAGQKFGSPAELLSKGTELLNKSPEFARLNEEVREKLLDAGKAAVIAAATQRVTTLTDSVESSAERIATGGPLRVKRPRAAEGAEGDTVGKVSKATDLSGDKDGDKPSRNPLLRFRGRRGKAEPDDVESEQSNAKTDDDADEDVDRPRDEETDLGRDAEVDSDAAESDEPEYDEPEDDAPAAVATEDDDSGEPPAESQDRDEEPARAPKRRETAAPDRASTGTRVQKAARGTTRRRENGAARSDRAARGGDRG